MRRRPAGRQAHRYVGSREARVIPTRFLRPAHPRRILFRAARGTVAAARESRVHRVWHASAHDVAPVPGWRAEIRYRHADLILFAVALSAGKVAQAMKALLPSKPAQP